MEWDRIAKGWRQLIAKIVGPRNSGWNTEPCIENTIGVVASGDSRYSLKPPTPYTPDGSSNQSASSLHLGC
jgi:hypothetical protein